MILKEGVSMPYIFTDYNNMIGKRPREIYWKEIHDAIMDIDTRMNAGSSNGTTTLGEYKPATSPINQYDRGITTFQVIESVSTGFPTLKGIVETAYVSDMYNIQHFFTEANGLNPGDVYHRQWNVYTQSWTNWEKLLTVQDIVDHIADHTQDVNAHINETDRKRLDGFVHKQNTSSDTWTIVHNLNKFVSITVADSSGRVVEGDYKYISSNEVVLLFSSPFSGTAYLS